MLKEEMAAAKEAKHEAGVAEDTRVEAEVEAARVEAEVAEVRAKEAAEIERLADRARVVADRLEYGRFRMMQCALTGAAGSMHSPEECVTRAAAIADLLLGFAPKER